jgi:hypothetical protein
MSRNVDASDLTVLSVEDLDYLESRGRVHIAHAVQAERKRRKQQENVVVEEVDLPYEKWKVADLREELKNRKLSTEGDKPELVRRLEENDAQTQD